MNEIEKMIPLEIGPEDVFQVDDINNPKILNIFSGENYCYDGKQLDKIIKDYIVNKKLFRNIEVIEFVEFINRYHTMSNIDKFNFNRLKDFHKLKKIKIMWELADPPNETIFDYTTLVHLPQLQSIYVDFDAAFNVELIETLSSLPNLEEIGKVSGGDIEKVPNNIQVMPKLKKLTLGSGTKYFLEFLTNNPDKIPNLEELTFHLFGDWEAEECVPKEWLKKFKNLKKVNMDNSKYCEEIMEEWEEHDLNKIEEAMKLIKEGSHEEGIKILEELYRIKNQQVASILGSLYYLGQFGVVQDFAKAKYWIEKSAIENNNAKAQGTLGLMYYEGKGVEKNLLDAYLWISRSVTNGEVEAQELQKTLEAAFLPDDLKKAKKYVEMHNQMKKIDSEIDDMFLKKLKK